MFKELVIRQYQLQMRVQEQTDAVQAEIQTWRGQRKWLIEKAMEGIISDTVLKEQLKEVEDKLLVAELKAAEHTAQKCDVQSILDYAASFMQRVNHLWFDASFEDKLTYQKLVYPKAQCTQKAFLRTRDYPSLRDNRGTWQCHVPSCEQQVRY
ncbi:MAG: hypothetical protein R3E39_06590 [Anaerolineae bacterium]